MQQERKFPEEEVIRVICILTLQLFMKEPADKKAETAVHAAEERLLISMTERKTQERLRENAFEAYRQEVNAEEQKEMDERTSFQYSTGDTEEA